MNDWVCVKGALRALVARCSWPGELKAERDNTKQKWRFSREIQRNQPNAKPCSPFTSYDFNNYM